MFSCVLIKDKIERVQQELIALPLFALWQQTGQRHLQHPVLAVDSDAVRCTGGFEIVSFADGRAGINQMPQPAGNPLCTQSGFYGKCFIVVGVGGYNLPTNVAHSLEDVEGLYVTADLAAGDYILTSKVSSVPISSDVALNDIPSGKVAISLTVKTLASGLSDKLQPNDIVRIYHFLETAEEVPELRFVKVLSVTDSDGINVDNTKEPTEDEEPQQSATITVLASPEQARIITELENDGVAHVALISRNNDQLAEELLAEQDKTLQEIYFPETLTEDGENEGTDATGDPASAEDSGENTQSTPTSNTPESGE